MFLVLDLLVSGRSYRLVYLASRQRCGLGNLVLLIRFVKQKGAFHLRFDKSRGSESF
jgi:hypothetical protein